MKFEFRNKVIYVLSPEKWGVMRFSKHHYALELASLGNQVYFINPPDLSISGVKVEASQENPLLKIVSYKPVFRGKRFLPGWMYRILLRMQVGILLRKIGAIPDVVWCFDVYRFENLNWFGARNKIFFLADLLSYDYLPGEAVTSDFSLALSESRIKQLKNSGRPVYFINHGLSNYYVRNAQEKLNKSVNGNQTKSSAGITAGYVGNLLMEAPDRETMKKIIALHPEITFVFWGQYDNRGNLVGHASREVFEFIDFLKSRKNVVLKGPVHPEVLSKEIEETDLLWVCWRINVSKVWDGSNPHKIIEYLSTGKPLVTHFMDVYKNSALVDMVPDDNNDPYPALFDRVVERVKTGEDPELQKKRIAFALDNSYINQIRRVEDIINGKVNPE